ncbi:hypothetical protein SEA_SPEEDDEMON_1590 [Gordonia phage SpeedDemon]|nr:hypothetical protein SEA_SPEEDDEMON_1590 [Gordonia phage SpeedDemon]
MPFVVCDGRSKGGIMTDHNAVRHEVERILSQVQSGGHKFHLVYIDYRDELNNDQIAEYMDEGYVDSIHESDWYLDARYDAAMSEMDDLFRVNDVMVDEDEYLTGAELRDIDNDLFDELRFAVEEYDESDIEKQLISNTPDQLFRIRLADDARTRDVIDAQDDADPTAWLDVASEVLEDAGIPVTSSNMVSLRDICAEQYHYGGALVALVYLDIATARALEEHGGTISQPEVWVHDAWNGAAYGDTFDTEIEIPAGRVRLDANAGGYSIDGICGLVRSAFRADVKVAA